MLKNQLIHALGSHLDCNLARLKCLSLLIFAVLRHRTVNLTLLATTPDDRACSNESRYRRFQDFFLRFTPCHNSVARCMLERIPKPREGFVLAMDRTNWSFGRREINFLVVGIVVGKVSIPIVWKLLPEKTKQGNSNATQRIALTRRLLRIIPSRDIRVLTMDREFNGKQWLHWLDSNDVGYVLRIKKNVVTGKRLAGEQAQRRGRKPTLRRTVFAMPLYFGSKKMKKGGRDTHLMVVSNRFKPKEALRLYKQRWGIERLFGHLKKKGFDLEATHMTHASKLETLFAVIALAFVFSYAWGSHLRHSGRKNNAASKRKSLFRLGLEDILNLLQSDDRSRNAKRRWHELRRWLARNQFNTIFLV